MVLRFSTYMPRLAADKVTRTESVNFILVDYKKPGRSTAECEMKCPVVIHKAKEPLNLIYAPETKSASALIMHLLSRTYILMSS